MFKAISISVVCLLLSSCIIPVPHGSYYKPIYPEKPKEAWVSRSMDGVGPPENLRIRSGSCYMGLRAIADEGSFVLSWAHEELSCKINVHGKSIEFEDLDSNRHWDVSIFRRVFRTVPPRFDINQAVDLAAIIPGFAATPESEQKYTLSIYLSRKFQGPLPDSTRIQLPNIVIGDQTIEIPVLQLYRHNELLSPKDSYLPDRGQKVAESTLRSEFGEFLPKSVVVWHEKDSLLRLAASFAGTPDSFDYDTYAKIKGVSEIFGTIYVEVLAGEPVRLTDERVSLRVPDDKQDHFVPVYNSRWIMQMYTTTDISERLEQLSDYWHYEDVFDDSNRNFVIVIPDYQPNKLSVVLPPVTANGVEWPVQPIVFERRLGGVGFGGL